MAINRKGETGGLNRPTAYFLRKLCFAASSSFTQDFLNTGGRICNRENRGTQRTQRIDQVPCGTGFVFAAVSPSQPQSLKILIYLLSFNTVASCAFFCG